MTVAAVSNTSRPFAERFIDDAEGRIRFLEAGSGPDLVLIHGAISAAEDMMIALSELAHEFRLIAFDRPGHGLSSRPRLHGSPLQQAARLRGAMQALGLSKPVLVGHSFGGSVALSFALEWPEEVSGLVLIAPIVVPELRLEHLLFGGRIVPGYGEMAAFGPGRLRDAAVLPLLWEGMFAPQRMPPRFRQAFPFELAGRPEEMLATGEDAVQGLPNLAAAFWNARQCQLPTVILAGGADLVVNPVRHAAALASVMPRADLHIEAGVGHMLHHFRFDLVAGAVRKVALSSP